MDDTTAAGLHIERFYQPAYLPGLLKAFEDYFAEKNTSVYESFKTWQRGEIFPPEEESALLMDAAVVLGDFIASLFQVQEEVAQQKEAVVRENETIFRAKPFLFKWGRGIKKGEEENWDLLRLSKAIEHLSQIGQGNDAEMRLACFILALATEDENTLRASLEANPAVASFFAEELKETSIQKALQTRIGHFVHAVRVGAIPAPSWRLFKEAQKADFFNLVETDHVQFNGLEVKTGRHFRRRDGFKLTDTRGTLRDVLFEVHHCVYCHKRQKDFCAKGMPGKDASEPFARNPLGTVLNGCPLEERISEFNWLKKEGENIAALALIMVDNPMVPGTGHRICNDCMKSCIHYKTEPVNIPQIETHILTEVLNLPYGFEIYSLLTRWNPLNRNRPYALPYNGKKVLVVGMGPAGYTLAHYLLNEGFAVVGIDGLKIEPLPDHLAGLTPIKDMGSIFEPLDERILQGFGGVAEYGITVRWDKNFLKLIYTVLARRDNFRLYGGVRFGGTLTVEEAWNLGFDHIALAQGAGKPTLPKVENNLVRGVRTASDFLMGLQLTGAAKKSSLANLQIRLPAGVIGGGLTAIDACTEVLAYYPIQVEKILERYETAVQSFGEEKVLSRFDAEEKAILQEFLEHGRAIAAERRRASSAGETPNFLPLLWQWGGVTLFYRKTLTDAPAYRQNHEEIIKAMEEGIAIAESFSPHAIHTDAHGHLEAVTFIKDNQENVRVPLKTLLYAAGTAPNTIYNSENPGTFALDGKYYAPFALEEEALQPVTHAILKKGPHAPFTSYDDGRHRISYYGDNHPTYAGNVVKAMASAKYGYREIVRLFEKELTENPCGKNEEKAQFFAMLDESLKATVVEVKRLTPGIVEVFIKAPFAAKRFLPGQFYRIQNFESSSPTRNGVRLSSEGMALTGATVDPEKGMLSVIVLELGASTKLCATWQKGEPIVAMGPTGAPSEIPQGKTVVLVGGGLGNAVLFSIGRAMKAAGNRVLYFAGYRKKEDIYHIEKIKEAADVIVWAVDPAAGATPFTPRRQQDKSVVANIVDAMRLYGENRLGAQSIPLRDAEHLLVIGSDRMMAAVHRAVAGELKGLFHSNLEVIGSINSPMQCMMKEICGQCLCKHKVDGKETFVYSCFNQDQKLAEVDFSHLNARLRQNSVQEKLADLYLECLLPPEERVL